MKKRTIAKKSMVAIMICSSFIAVRPVSAFVWPVIDITQVGNQITDITNGVSKVVNTLGQIETTIETISAVGDPANLAAQFQSALSDLGAAVGQIKVSGITVQKGVEFFAKNIDTVKDVLGKNNQNTTNTTIQTVDSQIDNGATENEVQTTIDDAKNEVYLRNQELKEEYTRTANDLIAAADSLINRLNEGVYAIENDDKLTSEEKSEYKKETADLVKQATDFKVAVQDMLDDTLDEFEKGYAKQLTEQLDRYSQGVRDFYAGKISREDLSAIAAEMQKNIASKPEGFSEERMNKLVSMAENLADSVQKLQENILNSRSNSREYSDDDASEKVSSVDGNKYLFEYSSNHISSFAKGVYSKDSKNKTFLLSKELLCHTMREDDLTKLEANTSKLLECVILAKTEKEYICGQKNIDVMSPQCDPFELEPNKLYLQEKGKYRKTGVYSHIVEDYSVANIEAGAKNQQFAQSWNKDKYEELSKLIGDGTVDNTKDAYSALAKIEFEAAELWSKARQVDALYRAKKAVQQYKASTTLYLDGRAKDFSKISQKNSGLEKNIETKDGPKEKQVFSNAFLYLCDLDAKDITVSWNDEQYAEKVEEAEEKIALCLYKYALAVSERKDGEKDYCGGGNVTYCQKEWDKKIQMIVNETYFHTLVLATTNSHKSSYDYAKHPKSGETTINTLKKAAKKTTDARKGYAYGADVNYYTTSQVLDIVDADAQYLQTEILEELPGISYNYFDSSFDEKTINAKLDESGEYIRAGGGN